LSVVRRLEGKDDRAVRRRPAVTTVGGADVLPGLATAIRSAGCAVSDSEYESARKERLTLAFDVDTPAHVSLEVLLRAAESQPGVVRVRIAAPD
jgi:hypothetical protein